MASVVVVALRWNWDVGRAGDLAVVPVRHWGPGGLGCSCREILARRKERKKLRRKQTCH